MSAPFTAGQLPTQTSQCSKTIPSAFFGSAARNVNTSSSPSLGSTENGSNKKHHYPQPNEESSAEERCRPAQSLLHSNLTLRRNFRRASAQTPPRHLQRRRYRPSRPRHDGRFMAFEKHRGSAGGQWFCAPWRRRADRVRFGGLVRDSERRFGTLAESSGGSRRHRSEPRACHHCAPTRRTGS